MHTHTYTLRVEVRPVEGVQVVSLHTDTWFLWLYLTPKMRRIDASEARRDVFWGKTGVFKNRQIIFLICSGSGCYEISVSMSY